MNMQVNITIPEEWKIKLDKLARQFAYERDQPVTYNDVIRESIREYCKIKDDSIHEECKQDIFYFVENFVKLTNPITGLEPVKLHDFQRRYIEFIDMHDFSILTKFRHGGFTTMNAIWAAWRCIFNSYEKIAIVSKTDRESRAIQDILSVIVDNLPLEIRPELVKNTCQEKRFLNKSSIICCNHNQIRGKDFNCIIIDEAAFYNTERIWKEMYSGTGAKKWIVVSTPTIPDEDGNLTWFDKTLLDARNKTNNFSVFECSYQEHPFYTLEKTEELKKRLGETAWKQEVLGRFDDKQVISWGVKKC